jgi:hypothetical protein
MSKCRDCGTNNRTFFEYCIRCGSKLTKSHRELHSNAVPPAHFILDLVR